MHILKTMQNLYQKKLIAYLFNMKHIDNYISEKLHIKKDMKINEHFKNNSELLEFLKKNNLECKVISDMGTRFTWYIVNKKGKELPYIHILFNKEYDGYFAIEEFSLTNEKKIRVMLSNSEEEYDDYDAEDLGMDFVKNTFWSNDATKYNLLDITYNNANIIINLFNEKYI